MFSSFPSVARIILSLKLYIAAMIALGIAFWQGFDYPYWTMMTVYILALDSSGAMRQKWAYMLTGTIVGAGFGVLSCFLFAHSQIGILISLAVIFLIAAFLATRDRLPSFYGFLIGGVTCLLVALPGITTPNLALFRAIDRIQDIVVGATILFAVDTLIFPKTGTVGLRQLIDQWLGQLRTLSVSALRGEKLDDQLLSAWINKTAAIDPLASYLNFERVVNGAQRRRAADTIRTLGLRIIPLLAALRDTSHDTNAVYREAGEPLTELNGSGAHDVARETLANWIEAGTPPDQQRDLHRMLQGRQIDSARPPDDPPVRSSDGGTPSADDHWRRLRATSQRRCLRALFSAWCLIGRAERNMNSKRAEAAPLPAGSRPTPTALGHVDLGYTLRIVFAVMAHFAFFCVLWSTFEWVSGYAALGVLLSSVFLVSSCRSNAPLAVLLKIARVVGIALTIVTIYVTVIMPHVSSMATVALVLFLPLFILGTVVPDPGNVLFAILPMALLRLGNNGPSVDFPTVLNSVVGLALGLSSAILAVILFVRLPKNGILRRLQQESRHDIYDVLQGKESDGRAYSWRAQDRFILTFQQAQQQESKQKQAIVSRAMREWRLGADVAALHHQVLASSSLLSKDLHRALVHRFHSVTNETSDPAASDSHRLLELIDASLISDAIAQWPARARAALVDIRTALYPDAPFSAGNKA